MAIISIRRNFDFHYYVHKKDRTATKIYDRMKVGDKAPNFTLKNSKKEEISLKSLVENGKVLILFFPLAFSSVCTEEMCSTRDNMKLYNSLNVNVVGISVDSFYTLREFKKSNNLNFTLLSDFNKEVSTQFEVLNHDFFGMKGVAKRSAFVINQDLMVEYAEILEDAGKQPDYKKIQEVLG
ncbi:MAG: redoxin domain-containing protein [Candidatus Paceibacterota bacterium]